MKSAASYIPVPTRRLYFSSVDWLIKTFAPFSNTAGSSGFHPYQLPVTSSETSPETDVSAAPPAAAAVRAAESTGFL